MNLPSPRRELLALHRKIYLKQKKLIDDSVSHVENQFKHYEKRYLNTVKNYQKIVEVEEVTPRILEADIVYIGDYHTLNQSQRSLMRVLRTIIPLTDNFVLMMEVIRKKYQKELDAFMKGRLKDLTFLKKTGFKAHWFFDLWDNFKPIFDFAKYHKIPMLALEAAGEDESLKKRDKAMARRIFETWQENPGKKIFVFVGDLHLAREHLPFEVSKIFKSKNIEIKTLTLFQNSEAIYWKLAAIGLEDKTHVVQISDKEFCRMHTPPIIAQQSYLNWLEFEGEVLDFADAQATFLNYLDQIANFLELEAGDKKYDVEVFTCGDLSFLKKLRESGQFGPKEMRRIKDQILREESYYIPKMKLVYLANVSVNHAAEEASHTLKHLLSGDEFPRNVQDAFYAASLHEALGFFGSKIINTHRKCLRAQDFKKLIQYIKGQRKIHQKVLDFETAKFYLEHEAKIQKGSVFGLAKIKSLSPDLFFALSHALGYALGEKLFYGLLAGVVTKASIRELYKKPFEADGEMTQVYKDLYLKLAKLKLPRKV